MLFNSLVFLAFLPLAFGAYWALNRSLRLQNLLVIAASYVFYGWWNVKCCALMLALTLTAHFCSLQFCRRGKKVYIIMGVIFPLLILGVFKYFNFFIDSFCAAFGIIRGGGLSIILPVGISFYTFQSLSYTIDVYRGKISPETDFIKTALYISFFPQLVAGPIVKAGQFLPQLHEDRTININGLSQGVQIFVIGLFKKTVLADNISVFVDAVYNNPAQFGGFTVLLAVFTYSVQIYCDFSGYSDMAVGCAKCLGYELPRNFNLPYLSKNVSEFWKRWHISLSSWLQEYLYIPLGGNRKGKVRTYVNLFVTMLLGGLWHGASWTFVAWGALHGIALAVHKLYQSSGAGIKHSALRSCLSVLLTFCFVSFCWIFFRADSFEKAWRIICAIFSMQPGMRFISSWAVFALLTTAGAEVCAVLRSRKTASPLNGYYPLFDLGTVRGLTIFFVFTGLTLALAYTGASPFIYFQF